MMLCKEGISVMKGEYKGVKEIRSRRAKYRALAKKREMIHKDSGKPADTMAQTLGEVMSRILLFSCYSLKMISPEKELGTYCCEVPASCGSRGVPQNLYPRK